MLVLLAAVVTGAMAQTTYNVTLKTGTVDATKWEISPTEAAADAPVTATYSGGKNVMSVKAVKKTTLIDSPVVGQIIGSDGKNHDAGTLPSGVTAVAIIVYVGSSTTHDYYNDVYYKGLALALQDEVQGVNVTMAWEAAKAACSGKKAIDGASWMLPSRAQWETMGATSSTYAALRDGFTSIGGVNMQPAGYWSATEATSFEANYCNFNDGSWGVGLMDGTATYRVRACLAF